MPIMTPMVKVVASFAMFARAGPYSGQLRSADEILQTL